MIDTDPTQISDDLNLTQRKCSIPCSILTLYSKLITFRYASWCTEEKNSLRDLFSRKWLLWELYGRAILRKQTSWRCYDHDCCNLLEKIDINLRVETDICIPKMSTIARLFRRIISISLRTMTKRLEYRIYSSGEKTYRTASVWVPTQLQRVAYNGIHMGE